MMVCLVLGVILLFHVSFICWVMASWQSIDGSAHQKTKKEVALFLSVIVPVRNEEKSIAATIRSIAVSSYEPDNFEILVVNDHSTDSTLEILRKLTIEIPQLSLLSNPSVRYGKKKAIELGVSQSKGDVIICTDGDCLMDNDWQGVYANYYQMEESLAMLTGPVKYKEDGTLLNELLNLELSVLVLMGAATLNRGIPSMANGANLSFKKLAFIEVNGFQGNDHIPSGDDEFLLRKIWNRYQGEVNFLKDKKAIVTTKPPESFMEFFQQRKRWSSKWRHHSGLYSKLIPVFLFLVNIISVWAMASVMAGIQPLPFGIFLISKAIVEYIIIKVSTDFLGVKMSVLGFLMLQIIYPFYVVFFGLASNFGKYAWKDRVYEN